MVSFGLLVGAALAGVYNWASGVYSYNRDAWMTDIQVEQAHVYQEDNLQIQLKAMQREEVRDLVNSDLNRINNSLLVATLILSLAGEMLFEGQIPMDCPAFVLNAYMLCLGSAVFHLSFSILFGICASSKAYRRASRLLTRFIRPQWKEHFQKMSRRKATENTATFESKPLSRMMMPPLASRMFGGRVREEWQADPRNPGNPGDPEHRHPGHRHPVPGKGSPSFTATWSNRTESEGFFSPQRCPRRWGPSRSLGSYAAEEYDRADSDLEKMHDAKPGDWHWHVALWKDTSQSWVKFSSCMFKCVARGTMNLLEACGYLAVGTLYSGYADAWAFWAIQILFTVINIMIVHFLLDSFEPSNIKSDWLIWLLRRHPFVVACIVASGPLFCVIAAATSWVIFDRFLIPLCYGTHTFVNIYFVSMFTTDEEVQERHHDSDSENDQEGIQGQSWGPWAAQPIPASPPRAHQDFLPVQMLRQGTLVVNFLWSCAFLWALWGAWFGMDFKNSKAAVPAWRDTPPVLELSKETMASPSPFWKPHALVCPRNQVFVADRYHVYELRADNTKVERYPCMVNGTIADIAAACNQESCWPVVLLQGVPPLVLDCSTGRQDPLLQTTDGAGRIATNADRENSGMLQTLLATMGDKMIVQYGWSVEREAWEPLWDIEKAGGVLAMDLVEDRLLVFHRGGYLQAQDIESGRLCSTWAFQSSDAVIGGGCGNKDHSSMLILVKNGHGTDLMRARLPALDDCTGRTTGSQSNKPLATSPLGGRGCGLFCWAVPILLFAFAIRLCGLLLDVEDVYEKGFALYNILMLPHQAYEDFLQSYDVYTHATDQELEDAYGQDWREVEMRKHKHTYTVVQYYCALVGCQKMYVAPLFNTLRGNEENQVIFEYRLARWLKAGDWDDQPFNAGARRAEDPNAVAKKTKRVLEVGCGQGRILQELGRFLGADWKLMGMNLDGNQLRHAKERPVEVTMRDLNHMPYDWIANASVNGAYNLGAMTFQRDLEEHAQEMARILTPGSRFVVACDWTNFDDEKGLNLKDLEHRRLWSGARRLGAAGRYCYSEKEYVAAFTKYNFKHVHSELYGVRYVQALRDVNVLRVLAAEWMQLVAKVDLFGVLDQALTMMQRFGTDVENALEAHDRKLFTYCGSHVFELQR